MDDLFKSNQQKFHINSGINPETGRKIEINGPTYKKLVKKYGSSAGKVISTKITPVTGPVTSRAKSITKPVESRSKFIIGLPEADQEIIKHLDLKTLKDWILEDPYVESIAAAILSQYLKQYVRYDEDIEQNTFIAVEPDFESGSMNKEYDIVDFARDLFKAGKLKLFKIIVDYFNLQRDLIDYQVTSYYDIDLYARLFDELRNYLRQNGKFETYIKLAPRNMTWTFLYDYLDYDMMNGIPYLIIQFLIQLTGAARRIGLDDMIEQIDKVTKNWLKDVLEEANEYLDQELINDIAELNQLFNLGG